MREQIDEQRPRLISPANRRERFNVPEVAYKKGGLRGAEAIITRIAHDPAVATTSPSSASSTKLGSSSSPFRDCLGAVGQQVGLVLRSLRLSASGGPSKQTLRLILGIFLPVQSGGWSASLLAGTTDWTFDYNAALTQRATQ